MLQEVINRYHKFRFALYLHSACASFRVGNQADGCLALANSLRSRFASRGRFVHKLRRSKRCSEFGRKTPHTSQRVLTSFCSVLILYCYISYKRVSHGVSFSQKSSQNSYKPLHKDTRQLQ